MHAQAGAHGVQKRISDPLQKVVLETKVRSTASAVYILNNQTISQPPHLFLNKQNTLSEVK